MTVSAPPGTRRPRRRRQLDWELIACGVRGHALAGPDGTHDELLVADAGGSRWHRCLRCDAWVALPAAAAVPPGTITLPSRGRPLRDKIALRLIAIDRLVHFTVLALLGVAVLLFAAHRASLRDSFYRVLAALQGGVAGGPVQSSGHVGILHDLDRLFSLRSGTLTEVGIALLAYGALEGIEAVGLWYARRWAEYLTFISTAVFLPFEVYEIIHNGTFLKLLGFAINVVVVVYLLYRKRLFGLRGGATADEARRAREVSWDAVRTATLAVPAVAEAAP
jgi:uncharacterized membrane protein (DUF2068 family)